MAEAIKKTETKKEVKATPAKAPVKKETTKAKAETKKETTAKKEAKEEVKETKKDSKKGEKVEVKKKFIQKVKKNKIKKSAEAKKIQETLKDKKKLPTFRGRFGKKQTRKKSNKKWQKWRKPRSIDLDRGLQHGYRPKIGYRNKASIRDIHPSGYVEVRVENVADLAKVDVKVNAIRIGATVGKRKRNEIVTKANEKGIWILN
jgi:large subunit ribosomal protein L32e